MVSKTFARLVVASALSLLFASGCASRTEVILVVDSDIATLDQISIQVTDPSGMMMQGSNATLGTGQPPLPRTLGLTWSGGPLGPFRAVATGSTSGVPILSRTAVFSFVQNDTRVVHLDLVARCVGARCAMGQTCGPLLCASEQLGPADLAPYTGTIGHSPDTGSTAPVDAGTRSDMFVPPTPDMGMRDMFVPPPPDMGMRDMFVPPPDMGVDMSIDVGPLPDTNMCTNTQTDPNNCGFCGNVCMLANTTGDTCAGGRCLIGTCNTGFLNCDGRNSTGCEVNGQTDSLNCGMCGRRCMGGTSCQTGTCQ